MVPGLNLLIDIIFIDGVRDVMKMILIFFSLYISCQIIIGNWLSYFAGGFIAIKFLNLYRIGM